MSNYHGSKVMKEINEMLLKAQLDENSAKYWAKEEEKIRTIEKMLENGLDVQLISKITNMEVDKIEKIKNKKRLK